jgi:hypothetical protein
MRWFTWLRLLPLLAGCSFDPSASGGDADGVVGGAGDPSPDAAPDPPDLTDLDAGAGAPDADAGKRPKPGPMGR